MFYSYLSTVLLVVSLMPGPSVAPGRRPQAIENVYCGLMYDEELVYTKTIDRRAIIQAYNVGQNGSLCMTTCRIMSRGNVKPLDPIPSPDYIACATGPQYCYKGNCYNPKEISPLMRKDIKLTSSENNTKN